MIETNNQKQQQDAVPMQQSRPEWESEATTALTVRCAICEAIYAPSSLQLPFLQYEQGTLEATFMSICHFCFRCRRAACPQCWDEVHGVCGACVQEAHLPFRAEATPVDGLVFPPALQQSPTPQQQQQVSSLFVLVHPGRFYLETQARPDQVRPAIDTDPAVQPVIMPGVTPDNFASDGRRQTSDVPAASLAQTSSPEVLKDDHTKEKTPGTAKKVKKVSRLELAFTWIVLVILLLIVVVIALAEYIPAVNALVARVVHIDIHAEMAYLVHVVQQLFKK